MDFTSIYPLKVAIFNNFAKIRNKAFSQPTRNPRFSSEIALCATFAGTNRPKWNFSVNTASYRITEVSVPAPYYLPENEADRVKTISLQPGDIRSLVFKDYRTPTLTIYKLDSVSGAPIEGAQFHVTYTRVSDIPDAPATYDFGTLYSDANGEIPLHETGVKLFPDSFCQEE